MTATDDPNLALLLAGVRPNPADFARLYERHAGVIDWNRLLERAAAHKIEALFADRVATLLAENDVPAHVRERLSATSERAAARNAKAMEDLEQVDRCLASAGISYLLVKGPVLAQRVYDRPAQRHFFDLDLVVRESEIDAAQAALEELGYRLWGGDRYFGFVPAGAARLARATSVMRASLRRFGHELALVTDGHRRMPIDLHWHLLPPGRIHPAACRHLWEGTTTTALGRLVVPVLPPEATVLHLAMHAWSNRPWGFALLHLCDVAWALQRLSVDPRRLLDLADRWGGRADLTRSLYAVEHTLRVTLPPGLQAYGDARAVSARFRRLATAESLIDRCTVPAPDRWTRLRQEIDWGLAIGSLRSTGILLGARYRALLRYHLGRDG